MQTPHQSFIQAFAVFPCGHCIAICPSGALNLEAESEPAGIADPAILARHLKTRRSIRVWKDKPVTHDECEELIRITGHAPSGCNIHPVKWVVVNDPAKVKAFVAASTELLRTIPKENRMYSLAAGLLRKLDAQAMMCSAETPRHFL